MFEITSITKQTIKRNIVKGNNLKVLKKIQFKLTTLTMIRAQFSGTLEKCNHLYTIHTHLHTHTHTHIQIGKKSKPTYIIHHRLYSSIKTAVEISSFHNFFIFYYLLNKTILCSKYLI